MFPRSALVLLLGLCLTSAAAAAERVLTVFAAASLTNVLQQIGTAYTADTQIQVRFSFAASSALARQIESGAPVDAFVSADQDWMNYLQDRQLIDASSRANVASNSLVLIAPLDGNPGLKIAPGFRLAEALGAQGRLATGDPAVVPVGKYAQAALTKLGVWSTVEKRIVAADNVRTALNFVARGEAPLGIVYATDARVEPKVKVIDTFPASTHEPITYPAAATKTGGADAAAFVKYLTGARAQALFEQAGFGAVPCTFKWDVSNEVALFRTSPHVLAAGAAADSAPPIEAGRLYSLDLHPQEHVRFAAAPSKRMLDDGAHAGILKLHVPQAGRYRVAIDSGFWLDVIQAGKPLASVDFNGSQDCPGPRKIVVYDLPADTGLFLQMSAASASQVKLSVTRVPTAE